MPVKRILKVKLTVMSNEMDCEMTAPDMKEFCGRTFLQNSDSNITEVSNNSRDAYEEVERCIHKACDQMDAILNKIHDLELRHARAVKNGHLGAGNYELQLQVLRGVYNMYHTYCSKKSQILIALEEDLN